jgi:hypothetical protein
MEVVMKPNARSRWVAAASFAILVLALPVLSVRAQSGNRNEAPIVPGSPKPGDDLRPAGIRERQFKMMDMEREAARQPRSPEEEKLAVAQIAEDYKELQVVNNKMMSATMKAASPDYTNVSQSLGDIRKRALRLRENLGFASKELQKLEKAKHNQVKTVPELKSELLALDNSIMSFVKNAIFKNPDVVNVEEATKARQDLEYIIEKTQLLNKDIERLKKQ